MSKSPTSVALLKAIRILEENGENLEIDTMTDNEWFDMLAELRFASRQFEETTSEPAIAA